MLRFRPPVGLSALDDVKGKKRKKHIGKLAGVARFLGK